MKRKKPRRGKVTEQENKGVEEMKDNGLELLNILKLQKNTYIRLADGEKMITNPIAYEAFECESYRLQKLIGRENKKKLSKKTLKYKECVGKKN